MRLAWHNIAHERTRFDVTVLGITCATLLMLVQGSILLGFLGAASKIIDTTDADIWIAGRGAPCFEWSPAPCSREPCFALDAILLAASWKAARVEGACRTAIASGKIS